MSTFLPENIVAAQKAQLEALLGLSRQAFDGAEKLLQLNVQVLKTALEETQSRAKQALSVQDPREFIAIQGEAVQPIAEKTAEYGRELYQIISETQAGFAQAFEAQINAQQERAEQMLDNFSRNAPPGSETAVAAVKSAINASNAAYDSARKATKQAIDIAENNLDAVTSAAVSTAQVSAAATKRASQKTNA